MSLRTLAWNRRLVWHLHLPQEAEMWNFAIFENAKKRGFGLRSFRSPLGADLHQHQSACGKGPTDSPSPGSLPVSGSIQRHAPSKALLGADCVHPSWTLHHYWEQRDLPGQKKTWIKLWTQKVEPMWIFPGLNKMGRPVVKIFEIFLTRLCLFLPGWQDIYSQHKRLVVFALINAIIHDMGLEAPDKIG